MWIIDVFCYDRPSPKKSYLWRKWQEIDETMASNIVVSNGADITCLLYFPERMLILITNYHWFPTMCPSIQTTILTRFMIQIIKIGCNIPKAGSYWWNLISCIKIWSPQSCYEKRFSEFYLFISKQSAISERSPTVCSIQMQQKQWTLRIRMQTNFVCTFSTK